jgi:hypothetical protein
MPKFRKKPIVIEAEQWLGPESKIDGVRETPGLSSSIGGFFFVETLEGPLRVSPGDWIITGVAGEKYPCKDSIFKATYDPEEPWKPYQEPGDD